MISDADIMSKVGGCHEEVMITDYGVLLRSCAAIDRDVFSEAIVISDEDPGGGEGIKAKVLRVSSDDGSVTDGVFCPHGDT